MPCSLGEWEGILAAAISVWKMQGVVSHSYFSRWYLFQNPFLWLLRKFFEVLQKFILNFCLKTLHLWKMITARSQNIKHHSFAGNLSAKQFPCSGTTVVDLMGMKGGRPCDYRDDRHLDSVYPQLRGPGDSHDAHLEAAGDPGPLPVCRRHLRQWRAPPSPTHRGWRGGGLPNIASGAPNPW